LATIATHDLALVPSGPLHYLARPPKRIKLVPLAQDKQISATELFQKLQAEAKEEKKEQSTSGIFRFFSLMAPIFAFLYTLNCLSGSSLCSRASRCTLSSRPRPGSPFHCHQSPIAKFQRCVFNLSSVSAHQDYLMLLYLLHLTNFILSSFKLYFHPEKGFIY
jgi:hypothetical protein